MKPEPPVTAMRTDAIQAGTARGWPDPPLERTQTRVDTLFAVYAGLALLAWGTVDAPQTVHVHGVRLSAVITGLTTIIAVTFAVLLSKRTPRSVLSASVPIMAALAAGGIALVVRPRQTGLENFLVYIGFLAMLLSGTAVRWTTRTWRMFTVVSVTSILTADSLYASVVALHGLGGYGVVMPRAFAPFAVVSLALAVGLSYVHRPLGIALAAVQLAVLGASLSRTAAAAALVALCCSVLRKSRKRIATVVVLIAVLFVAGAALSRTAPALRERVSGGDQAIHIGQFTLNTEGRNVLWPVAWDYYLRSPIVGHGLGAASDHIDAFYPGIDHPHNDYLRILDDEGSLGASVLLLSLALVWRSTWRRWQARILDRDRGTVLAAAAWLALVGTSLLMLTDNVIVYDFVMAPLGLLIGLALAGEETSAGGPIAQPVD